MTSPSGLHKLGVLFLEKSELTFSFPIPDAITREQKVHFFERALVRFRIQSPDHGNSDNVTRGKDVICFFVESFEHDGAKKSEPAIANGPTDDAPCVALGANFKREDLSGVEPGNGQPGGSECSSKKKDHSDGTRGIALCLRRVLGRILAKPRKPAGEKHGDTLNDGAPVKSPAAADAVKREDANKGCDLRKCYQLSIEIDRNQYYRFTMYVILLRPEIH